MVSRGISEDIPSVLEESEMFRMQVYMVGSLVLYAIAIVQCEEGCSSDFTEFTQAVFSNHSTFTTLPMLSTDRYPNERVPLFVEVQYRV